MKKIKVAINGYGVIGKRVADAVALQYDMQLAGVCDVITDWRIRIAVKKKYPVYAATAEASVTMKKSGIAYEGLLKELLEEADIIIDCTPKKNQRTKCDDI